MLSEGTGMQGLGKVSEGKRKSRAGHVMKGYPSGCLEGGLLVVMGARVMDGRYKRDSV